MLFTTINGWMVIIPTFIQLFLLVFLVVISFFIGRATALNHLIKYHIREIEKDEIEKLSNSYLKLKLNYDMVKVENESMTDKLHGINYIISRS